MIARTLKERWRRRGARAEMDRLGDASPFAETDFPDILRATLAEGRAALAAGERAAARHAFARALNADPRCALLDWGLMASLRAEGRDDLETRLQARLRAWRRRPLPLQVRAVVAASRKTGIADWAARHAFATPRALARAASPDALDPDALPDPCVIKPAQAASGHGVVIARGGTDLWTGAPIVPDLPGHVAARWAADGVAGQEVLVEELVRDAGAGHDPALEIPRDYKCFAVSGRVVFVRVHDRNAPGRRRGLVTRDRSGAVLPASHADWPEPPAAPPDAGWDALIAAAERASRLLPCLLRFDFYLSPAGPVLGEITTYPNAGQGYPPLYRRTLLQMWETEPQGYDDGTQEPAKGRTT